MAPGLKRLFKRETEKEEEPSEDYEADDPTTTLATKVFNKHLHRGRITTASTTTEDDGGERHEPYIIKLILMRIYFRQKKIKTKRRRGNINRDTSYGGAESSRSRLKSGGHNRREDGHSDMGCRGNFYSHSSHHSWHMWILHSTMLPQATLQRRQEGHERS